MASAALRGAIPSRSLEFELWREGTTIGTRGMDQWGLAVPMLRRGVPAKVIAPSEKTFPGASQVARDRFTQEELDLAQFAQEENRRMARELGVAWERREPTRDDTLRALEQGKVPVLLVDLLALSGDYEAPHWVVVSEADDERVLLLDPDPDGPGTHRMTWDTAWSAGDVSRYLAERTLVVFGP